MGDQSRASIMKAAMGETFIYVNNFTAQEQHFLSTQQTKTTYHQQVTLLPITTYPPHPPTA